MDYFSNPPPGMDLSEDRTRSNNAIGIVLFILSAIAVGLRVLSRTRYQHVNLALDDYLMFLGLALNAGNLACCIAGGFFGLGKHIYSLQPENMAKISIITFAYVYIYAWSVCIIKYSILALYRRIFGMSWLNWWGIFLTTGYLITNHITLPLYCKPLSYYWNQWYNPAGGHCPVNEAQFYLGIGIINLFGDVCILVVPVQHVLKLQMNRTKKMAICVMFLLGGFVCIASLIRITTIVALTKTTDISWAKSDVFIWSSVEPSFGIISGCLPTLRPLIVHVLHNWFGYHDSQGSKEQPDSHQLPTLVTISKKKTRKIPGLSILEETQVDKSEGTVTITDTTTTTSTQRHSKDLEQGKQDQSDDEICLTSQHEEENDHHILRVDEVSVESDANSTTKDANSQYNRYGDPFHGHRS